MMLQSKHFPSDLRAKIYDFGVRVSHRIVRPIKLKKEAFFTTSPPVYCKKIGRVLKEFTSKT